MEFRPQIRQHGKRRGQPPRVAILLETSTEYGRGLLRGVGRYVSLHGPWRVNLLPGHLPDSLRDPSTWGVDGIIARIRSPQIENMLLAARLPFVGSDLSERAPKVGAGFGRIITDGCAISRMDAEHLLDLGLRNYAFCGFQGCMWSDRREQAFVDFVNSHGFECFVHRLHPATWLQRTHWMDDWKNEQPALAAWLKTLPLPIGVMACNDVCGIQLLEVCLGIGLQVPDDVAVLGVDNDETIATFANPSLSSLALDLEKAGYEAAQILDALMSHRSLERFEIRVEPTHVVERESTGFIAQGDSLVARALQIIRDEAKHGISVTDVVDRLGASRRNVEKRFRRVGGRSLYAEITHRQVQLAKRLLIETTMTSEVIATAVGFGTVETFNRAFRRSMHTSPHRFRQIWTPAVAETQRSVPLKKD